MELLEHFLAGASASCGLVLIGAGGLKVRDRRTFGSQIVAYDLLPRSAAHLLGEILPFAEILAGLLLLILPGLGGVLSAILFLAFAAAIGANHARGRRELVCGCFGPAGRQTITPAHVVVNLVMAALAVGASVRTTRPTADELLTGGTLFLAALLGKGALDLRRMIGESLLGPTDSGA